MIALKTSLLLAASVMFAWGNHSTSKVTLPAVPRNTAAEKNYTPPPFRPLQFNEINYEVVDNDPSKSKPVLVLLHGINNGIRSWDAVRDALSKKYKLVIVDLRGHGNTKAVGENYTSTALASDLKVLLDGLGIKKAVILGHSFGGRVASRFTALNPEYVDALIVEDMDLTSAGALTEKDWNATLRHSKAMDSYFNEREFPNETSLRAALHPYFKGEVDDLVSTRMRPKGTGVTFLNPSVSYLFGNQIGSEDIAAHLGKSGRPVLFLNADPQLSGVSKQGIIDIKKYIPKAEIETVGGASHSIHRSKPEAFVEMVDAYLSNGYKLPPTLKGKYPLLPPPAPSAKKKN